MTPHLADIFILVHVHLNPFMPKIHSLPPSVDRIRYFVVRTARCDLGMENDSTCGAYERCFGPRVEGKPLYPRGTVCLGVGGMC